MIRALKIFYYWVLLNIQNWFSNLGIFYKLEGFFGALDHHPFVENKLRTVTSKISIYHDDSKENKLKSFFELLKPLTKEEREELEFNKKIEAVRVLIGNVTADDINILKTSQHIVLTLAK
jgi:hypothetical protein